MKMGFSNVSILFLAIAILMAYVSYAQDSPQDYVNAHNAARSQVGVQPVAWDDNVAAFAQDYANRRKIDCQLIHSGAGAGRYGENIAWSSGDLGGTDAVRMWVDEKPYYNYYTNSRLGEECLHYTQVVWRSSVRIGCAKVRCYNGGTFITCNYSPPGNYIGQRPYQLGFSLSIINLQCMLS